MGRRPDHEGPSGFRVCVLDYLADIDEKNGALRLPSSHHNSIPIHSLLPEPHSEQADGL
jgi:hypothetical protein